MYPSFGDIYVSVFFAITSSPQSPSTQQQEMGASFLKERISEALSAMRKRAAVGLFRCFQPSEAWPGMGRIRSRKLADGKKARIFSADLKTDQQRPSKYRIVTIKTIHFTNATSISSLYLTN
ncbi:MAG: hypothetical protein ACJAVI_000535 [Candidatus Azotimanducaceae bacterium]